MAENENGEEKTEQATEKKRRDARKKGQVLKSQDISIVCSLFLTFLVLRVTAPLIFGSLSNYMQGIISTSGEGIGDMRYVDSVMYVKQFFARAALIFLICSGILLVVSFAVSIISTGVQTKFLISFETIKFKLDKLNPMKGIKNMFSLKKMFETAKSLLKMVILIAVVYNELGNRLHEIIRLLWLEPQEGLVYTAQTIFSLVMTIGMVFVAIAAADFLFQRWSFENDLKMTKQEVKDEYKMMEGDPKVKGKRRAIQQQMAQQRMMQEVPSADVVIRNPTHIAVAIRYDPSKAPSPVVVAKAKDKGAARLVEIAEGADVPTVENKPLARSLYEKIEVGSQITVEFYESVADVIWFVHNLKNKPIPGVKKPTVKTPYSY
ncbi:MAG: flagellar biosynthesis protein FlhB [Ruminococcus sp.]|nr:flagellar biosynthesis protein FlhB [Ruminococcus sp.]